MADRDLRVKFWGQKQETLGFAAAMTLTFIAILGSIASFWWLAAIPFIWAGKFLAMYGLEKWRSRHEIALQDNALYILDDGKPKQCIPLDEVAEIKAIRGGNGAIFIDKEGTKIEVSSGGYGWQKVADEIAMRIGFKVNLEPQLVLSKPPKPSTVLTATIFFFTFGFLAYAAIALIPIGLGLILTQVGIGVVAIGGLLVARRLGLLANRPDLYDPDLNGPMLKMSVESYYNLKGGEPPEMELEKGQEYIYLPSRRNFGRAVGLVGYPLALMGLGTFAYTFMVLLQSIFIEMGIPAAYLLLGMISGITLAFCGYGLATGSARGLKQAKDKITLLDDKIVIKRGRKTFECSLDQSPKIVKSRFGNGLFHHHEIWTDKRGRKVLIDRRFLWRSDRAMYEPESPWSDMWKGRVLPREIPE